MEPDDPPSTIFRRPDLPSASSPAGGGTHGASLTRRRQGLVRRVWRRLTGSAQPEQLLPLIIRVYAGFTRLDGEASEGEIDSTLGFMRYDYPETIYSELRELYRAALRETQDLDRIAGDLSSRLTHDQKIQLAVQLYVLISRSSRAADEMGTFQSFMSRVGVGSEVRGIVEQLREDSETRGRSGDARTAMALRAETEQPLEILEIGPHAPANLIMDQIPGHWLTVFRFHSLLLLKNTGSAPVIARGRQLRHGEFLRLYEGQRVVLGDTIIDYQDLVFYLNAKKGVSNTQIYLSIGSNHAPFVERERSKLSVMRIRFGLSVQVTSLKESEARVNGRQLARDERTLVALSDRISFPDSTGMSFAELRRRARELGGRFDLSAARNDLLVSNNPDNLRAGDILLSPALRSEILLRIRIDSATSTGTLEVLKAARSLSLGRLSVKEKETVPVEDGALVSLGEGQYLRCRFSDGIIEEERNIIRQLEVQDITHRFGRTPGLDSISLSVRRGEMVCVMGPSGSGKSLLMRILAGHLKPQHGRVLMNGQDLYANQEALVPFISSIPHEDAFDPLLTVEENLHAAAAMRSPQLQKADLKRRVDAKLVELGLYERRHRLAGLPEQKILSSGERKRLNIGLDMITPADVYLFDEPTSGLSSKDSEHVLEIIRGLAHNKIVFVSIHQPSARLFQIFHKAILLDNGGRLVFSGRPQEMLDYFRGAWEEQLGAPAAEAGTPLPQPDFHQPEFVFDVLETPLRDLSGDVIYEEDARGHTSAARRFTPDFWRDRYQAWMLAREARDPALRTGDSAAGSMIMPLPPPEAKANASPRERSRRFLVMMRRALLSKLRNRANLLTTLLEAPLLAGLISGVLRFNEKSRGPGAAEEVYNFASAFHIPTYLFLALVVAMFLGLTNSADEIIRDRVLLQRERNINKNVFGYITSKFLALAAFSVVQNVIFLAIGNAVLEIRAMFWPYLLWMTATSLTGVGLGLLISSLVRDSKTALNIIPLILIPNIILGGALIKYEEMNRNLSFAYSIRQWNAETDAVTGEKASDLKVPLLCEFMPLRWSYESLVLEQAWNNPLASAQEQLQARLRDMLKLGQMTEAQEAELTSVKEALSWISAAAERNPDALVRRMDAALEEGLAGTFDRTRFAAKDRSAKADHLFENRKIRDLVNKAEAERLDHRRSSRPNVFFGREKHFRIGPDLPRIGMGETTIKPAGPLIDLKTDTLSLNGTIMVMWVLLPLLLLYLTLRRQLRLV